MIGLCLAAVVLAVMVVVLPISTTREIRDRNAPGAWIGVSLVTGSAWGLYSVIQAIFHA